MEATRSLRDEHRLIGRVLDAFEIALERFAQGVAIERTLFESFLEFFRVFADEHHHRKEEEQLFPRLERAGVALDGTPVAQVLDEHERARELVSELSRELAAVEAGDAFAGARVRAAGDEESAHWRESGAVVLRGRDEETVTCVLAEQGS